MFLKEIDPEEIARAPIEKDVSGVTLFFLSVFTIIVAVIVAATMAVSAFTGI